MNTPRLLALLCCVAACDLGMDDDGPSNDDAADETGDEGDDDDGDDDGTDPDPDPDPDTGSDTSPDPGDALPDSVFVYLHDTDGWSDAVYAYDVATDEAWLVTDLGGDVEIRSVAIHPDRTTLAVSALYELVNPDDSEGIWRVSVDGGAPEPIMDAVSSDAEGQNVADLAYTWDGSQIWFGYSNASSGGGLIGSVSDAGGEPEFFGDSNGSCIATFGPSPGPSGVQLLALREGCSDRAQEGLVLLDMPPTTVGQVAVAESTGYTFESAVPQWSADGTAAMFVMSVRLDVDGDGLGDADGDTIMAFDFASAQFLEVVPPAAGQRIYGFAVAPDESGIAMCMASAAGQDLVLLDLSGETASYRTLTSDGKSCRVAW